MCSIHLSLRKRDLDWNPDDRRKGYNEFFVPVILLHLVSYRGRSKRSFPKQRPKLGSVWDEVHHFPCVGKDRGLSRLHVALTVCVFRYQSLDTLCSVLTQTFCYNLKKGLVVCCKKEMFVKNLRPFTSLLYFIG